MSLSILLIVMLGGTLLTYVLSRINKKMGSYFTIVISLAGLVLLYFIKDKAGDSESIYYFNFKITTLGWYFSLVMLIVYFTTAFFNPFWIKKLLYPSSYNMLYILSLTGTIGMFFAKDLLTLFIFLETVVWSSTYIIQLGKSRKASYVYYVVSAIGSMVTFYAIMLMQRLSGTLEINEAFSALSDKPGLAIAVFFMFVFAGLTKLGIFPFHVWLPIAHGNAPHTFSPVLSGGLVKMGAYIAVLSVTAFPAYKIFENMGTIMGIPVPIYLLMILGAISIIVGTVMAIKQEDAKKLLAYSSVANGGYILIGILMYDQMGFAGGLMHLMNHALASAAAFLAIAAVAYRTGTTKMSELGGMIHKMPVSYLVYLIAIISMAGIPPMGGFVSKWLILQGLSNKGLIFMAGVAAFGSIGSFLYVFRPLSAVFLGQLSPKYKDVKEVNIFMQIPMIILTLITLLLGVFPNVIIKTITEIQSSLGLDIVETAGNTIVSLNGYIDMFRVFIVFGFGFAIAFVLFVLLPKSRRVGLMDTYTSAEFIHTPELLHYSHDFYAPFERMFDKFPSTMKLYHQFSNKLKELGQMTESVFYDPKPGHAVFWVITVFILFYVGGVL